MKHERNITKFYLPLFFKVQRGKIPKKKLKNVASAQSINIVRSLLLQSHQLNAHESLINSSIERKSRERTSLVTSVFLCVLVCPFVSFKTVINCRVWKKLTVRHLRMAFIWVQHEFIMILQSSPFHQHIERTKFTFGVTNFDKKQNQTANFSLSMTFKNELIGGQVNQFDVRTWLRKSWVFISTSICLEPCCFTISKWKMSIHLLWCKWKINRKPHSMHAKCAAAREREEKCEADDNDDDIIFSITTILFFVSLCGSSYSRVSLQSRTRFVYFECKRCVVPTHKSQQTESKSTSERKTKRTSVDKL